MLKFFNKRLKIGAKIAVLPVLAVIGLLIIAGVDMFLRQQLSEMLSTIRIYREMALELSNGIHNQGDYLANPNEAVLAKVKNHDAQMLAVLEASRAQVAHRFRADLEVINSAHLEIHEIFDASMKTVQAITAFQGELIKFFHENDDLAQKKSDEISALIFSLMIEGKDLSPAKRELRNALREYVGLSSAAMLNTNELLFLSDKQRYEQAEKERQHKLSLVMRACRALSVSTDDPDDRQVWAQIEEKQGRINGLRSSIFEYWQVREEKMKLLDFLHEGTQHKLAKITAGLNAELKQAVSRHKWLSEITIIGTLFLLILVSFILIRHIVRPIHGLTRAMNKIKDGDFDISVDVQSADEIGVMAATFNEMISQRQKAEEIINNNERKYRRLLESTNTIPWELDLRSNTFTYMGQQVEEILGYPVDSWAGFEQWAERVHPDDREAAVNYCQFETKQGKNHDFIYRAMHANGTNRWIHDVVSVISDVNGPLKLVGFMHDITERKLAEEMQVNLEKRLMQAQKMETIGTLAGGIAHDFNNILGVIIGYAELAEEDAPPGSTLKKDIGKILIGANRAKELVKQILSFSRQSQAERMPMQVQPIIKEVLKMLRASIPSTISIVADIDPKCGIVLADPTQIHQILMNLCTNAYHAMEPDGGALSVGLKTIFIDDEQESLLGVGSGEYLQLRVADTGVGISPDAIGKVFEPYFTTKEIGKGTGMGLAIIHGIVKDYGGAVTVESELAKGSIFQVYFPVIKQDILAETKGPEDTLKGKERILFVDDEELLAEMGKDMLERLGYHVTVRRSSLEALATFASTPDKFDLVITDQTMPEMTGSDLARRMMQIRPDIPVILCTGYSNLVDEHSAKALGIKEFVLKPITKEDISKVIRKVMTGAV